MNPLLQIGTDNKRLVLQLKTRNTTLTSYSLPAAPVAQPGEQIPPQDPCHCDGAWVKGQRKFAVLMLLTMDLDMPTKSSSSWATLQLERHGQPVGSKSAVILSSLSKHRVFRELTETIALSLYVGDGTMRAAVEAIELII
ncbi:hypothetical protein Tco_0647378 [Tanacetum coccineum]